MNLTLTIPESTQPPITVEVGGTTELTSYETQVESLPDYPSTFPPDLTGVTPAAIGAASTADLSAKQDAISLVQDRLLGRGKTSGTGAPEAIQLGTNLSLSGNTLNATGGGAQLNVKEAPFNAKGDAITRTSGVSVTSGDNTLICTTAAFTSADIGKTIQVEAGVAGRKQVATLAAAGAITGSGTMTVTITHSNFPAVANPVVVNVAVTAGDSVAVWLEKVRVALEGYYTYMDLQRHFVFSVVGSNLVTTLRNAFENDGTLSIVIAAGTATNASLPISSAITTTGIVRQDLITTISLVNSGTSVELTAPPTNTLSGISITYGTDDTAAIQAALNSEDATRSVRIPAGNYLLTSPLVFKRSGTSIWGDGKYSTILEVIDGTKHGIVWDGWQGLEGGVKETQQCDIHGIKMVGRGGNFHAASAIHARQENSDDFFTAISTISDVFISDFDTGMWFSNWAKNRVSDCKFGNNRIHVRLTKSDTFIMSNNGMGSAIIAAFSYGYYIEPSAGPLYTGANFGGIIEAGECGDVDRYIELRGGRVSVREPNLERVGMAGGAAVHLDGVGGPYISWHGGRISQIDLTAPHAGTAALFRVNSDITKGGVIHITGLPAFYNVGWRHVEVYGNSADKTTVTSSDQLKALLTRVNTATAGGAAVITIPIVSDETKYSSASFLPAGEKTRGVGIFHPSDTGGDSDLIGYRDRLGAYKISGRANNSLIHVLSDTSGVITNTTTGQTTLFTHSVPANWFTSNEQTVRIKAFGKFADTVNNKRIVVDWGGVTIYDSSAIAIRNNDWALDVVITREASAGRFHSVVDMRCDDPLLTNRLEVTKLINRFPNQANTLNIKATGGATADIELLFAQLYWMKNDSEY
jgi:hypothetical protein